MGVATIVTQVAVRVVVQREAMQREAMQREAMQRVVVALASSPRVSGPCEVRSQCPSQGPR